MPQWPCRIRGDETWIALILCRKKSHISPSEESVISALKQAGVEYVLSVPDLHTSHNLLHAIARDSAFHLIRVCKKDECLGIATGLSYGDKRAIILVQYTGFLYAMNAIRALACEQSQPMCLMIGLLNHKGGSARNSKRVGLRIVKPILDVLGVLIT